MEVMSKIKTILITAHLQGLLVFFVIVAESHASEKGEEFEDFADSYLEFIWESSPRTAVSSPVNDTVQK